MSLTKLQAAMAAADMATQAELDAMNLQFVGRADQTVANTTAETSMLSPTCSGSKTIPADIWTAGRVLTLRGAGRISYTSTPTATVRVKLGSTTLITNVAALPSGTVTDAMFFLEMILTCRTPGASGVVSCHGYSFVTAGIGLSTATHRGYIMASPATVDLTGPLDLDVTYQWGTASASNSITVAEALVLKPRTT